MTNQRIVLVTGATRGLGAEVSDRLAEKGLLVIVGGRDLAAAQRRVDAIASRGGEARALSLDVNDAASVQQVVQWCNKELGRLDVLVNNAGVMLDGSWRRATAPRRTRRGRRRRRARRARAPRRRARRRPSRRD